MVLESPSQVTFTEQLSRAAVAEEVTSKREAKRLAFFLFWNVQQDAERCATSPTMNPKLVSRSIWACLQ